MSDPQPTAELLRPGPRFQLGRLRSFALRRIRLPVAGLGRDLDGLRLLHVSDTHLRRRWEPGLDQLVADVDDLRPDLICFTGDWVEDRFDHRPGLAVVRRLVGQLRARLGLFAIVGNHDGDLLAPHLIDLGVTLLLGDARRIVGGDGTLELVGLPGVSRKDLTPDVFDAVGDAGPLTTRVVLAHFPSQVPAIVAKLRPKLILAGHTHGGQVCLPRKGWPLDGGRPLITHDPSPKQLAGGLHRVGDAWLHVSRGLGTSNYPVRAWCPPEVTVIELMPV